MGVNAGGERTRGLAAALWVVFVILIVARDPTLFTNPRMRAEEGSLFYSRVHHGAGLFDSIWLDVGYCDAIPVLAAWTTAKFLPLELAPYGMMGFALLSLLIPLGLLLGSGMSSVATLGRRFLAGCAFLAVASGEETWLSTLSSKFHWAVVPLLLAGGTVGGDRGPNPPRWRAAFAVWSGFASILAAVLLPLFAWTAWRRKSRDFRWIAGGLLIGVALQSACVLLRAPSDTSLSGLSATSRLNWQAWSHVPASALFDGLLPSLIGKSAARACVEWGLQLVSDRATLALAIRMAAAGLLGGLLWVGCRAPVARWVLAAYVALAAQGILFGLGNQSHPLGIHVSNRYIIVPATLFAWGILTSWPHLRGARKALAGLLVAALLGTGVAEAVSNPVEAPDRPRWRDEVARFRADPGYAIRIVPTYWSMRLGPGFDRNAHVERVLMTSEPSKLELHVAAPKLGGELRIMIRGAAPQARGLIVAQPGKPLEPYALVEFPSVQTVLPLALGMGLRFDFEADARGEWSHTSPLKTGDMFEGFAWTLQAVQISPVLVVSDGVHLRLGR